MDALSQPDKKWAVYGELLKYTDAAHIDTKEVIEKFKITQQAGASYLRNLKSGPNIYNQLVRAGYQDAVIPKWVHRPGAEGADARTPDAEAPFLGAGASTKEASKTPGISP
jgi:hypothetical protein